MTPYLVLVLLPMMALVGREAWLDRTPRKPWVWTRPELSWWAVKRTAKERRQVAVQLEGE